jgi:hypothetical protein
MAKHWYVDLNAAGSNNGAGGDGTDSDLADAWQLMQTAILYSSYDSSQANYIWFKRYDDASQATETPTANWYPGDFAYTDRPIIFIGWPRNSISITSATWTNNSTTVDLILPATMTASTVIGRMVTAPDGFDYLITKVTDTNTIIIDRPYVGSTVTLTSGASTIKEDDEYSWRPQDGIDAGWDSDGHERPQMSFTGTSYRVGSNNDAFYGYSNFEVACGTASPTLYVITARAHYLNNLYATSTSNAKIMQLSSSTYAERLIVVGNNAGTSQYGIDCGNAHGIILKNSAIYNVYYGLVGGNSGQVDNVNVGVEGTVTQELSLSKGQSFSARDLKFGSGTVYYYQPWNLWEESQCSIENYGKVLGATRSYTTQGYFTSKDVVAGSGDPYKRTGGADSILEITNNKASDTVGYKQPIPPWTCVFIKHVFYTDTTSRNYRYYVQSPAALNAYGNNVVDSIWITCTYISSYDASNNTYTKSTVYSDESISARTGADDWSQYIEVTGIAPAVQSSVVIKIYCNYYHASNKVYVDPKVVTS